MNAIHDARRDLDWLAHAWADLAQSRLKGTPRTWLHHGHARPPVHTDEELVTVHGLPAPLHLDVLDAMVDIVAWSDEVAENVSQTLGIDRLPHASSAFASPRPYLVHIADHLGPLHADEPATAEVIATEARQRAGQAARLMGLLTGGQVLDCECPYCRKPAVLTVIVRDGAEPLIVCMGACWMDDDHTGHAVWRGRRAWVHPDGWTQLAKIIEPAGRALTLADIARDLGVPYERVKKWRQRGFLRRLGQTPDGRHATYSVDDARARLAADGDLVA